MAFFPFGAFPSGEGGMVKPIGKTLLPLMTRTPLVSNRTAPEAGWTVVQVDVPYRPRAGRSKVTGTPLGVVRAVHDMTRVLAR